MQRGGKKAEAGGAFRARSRRRAICINPAEADLFLEISRFHASLNQAEQFLETKLHALTAIGGESTSYLYSFIQKIALKKEGVFLESKREMLVWIMEPSMNHDLLVCRDNLSRLIGRTKLKFKSKKLQRMAIAMNRHNYNFTLDRECCHFIIESDTGSEELLSEDCQEDSMQIMESRERIVVNVRESLYTTSILNMLPIAQIPRSESPEDTDYSDFFSGSDSDSENEGMLERLKSLPERQQLLTRLASSASKKERFTILAEFLHEHEAAEEDKPEQEQHLAEEIKHRPKKLRIKIKLTRSTVLYALKKKKTQSSFAVQPSPPDGPLVPLFIKPFSTKEEELEKFLSEQSLRLMDFLKNNQDNDASKRGSLVDILRRGLCSSMQRQISRARSRNISEIIPPTSLHHLDQRQSLNLVLGRRTHLTARQSRLSFFRALRRASRIMARRLRRFSTKRTSDSEELDGGDTFRSHMKSRISSSRSQGSVDIAERIISPMNLRFSSTEGTPLMKPPRARKHSFSFSVKKFVDEKIRKKFDGKKLAALNQFLDQCSTGDMTSEYGEVQRTAQVDFNRTSDLPATSSKKGLTTLLMLTPLVLAGSAIATAVMTCSFPTPFVDYEKNPEK